MDNNNNNKNNIYSFSLENSNSNYNLKLILSELREQIKEDKLKERKQMQNYRVAKIMLSAFWDESNGIFCDECGAQVNFWENPNGDLVVESYSVYNDLQEEQFNELSEEDKLLYKKCLDCFSYKKITSGKKEFSDCCKIRNTFKFSNGSISKEN